jgi:hypothetical protein
VSASLERGAREGDDVDLADGETSVPKCPKKPLAPGAPEAKELQKPVSPGRGRVVSTNRLRGHDKELAAALRRARKAGWTVVRTNNSHLRWYDPDGRLITTSGGTPGGSGVRVVLVQLKRAGLV